MNRTSKILALALSFSIFLISKAQALQPGFNIVEIANNSGPLSFPFYDWASLNENGLVCYKGASEAESAILKGDGSQRQAVASSTDANGLFEKFVSGICSINDSGEVAFDACNNCETAPQYGIYTRDTGQTLRVIQQTGPGPNALSFASLPSINNSSQVSFSGTLNDGTSGIFLFSAGQPLSIPFNSAGNFLELGGAFLNDSTQIVFGAKEDPDGSTAGIYGPSGNRIIGTFNGFTKQSLPVINNSGTVAVMATSPSQNGVYVNGVPFVTNTGDFAGVDISTFQAISMNNRGDILFPAIRPNGKSVVFVAAQGGMIPIIEQGDLIPGHSSPVNVATVSRESINDARQISLVVALDDETELVLRLDPNGVVFPDDNCPQDNAKFEPGVCGCGVSDADSNSDGILNCQVMSTLKTRLLNLTALLKKVKQLPSNASKKKKKANSQLVKQTKAELSATFALVDGSQAQIQESDSKLSALQLMKAVRTKVKKALNLKLKDFKKNKSSALTSLNKFSKVLIIP